MEPSAKGPCLPDECKKIAKKRRYLRAEREQIDKWMEWERGKARRITNAHFPLKSIDVKFTFIVPGFSSSSCSMDHP